MSQCCWHFTQKDTNPSWLSWCQCLLPLFPLRKKQITSSKGAWKKHLPVPGHWLQNSHRRTMRTWGHCTVSSTHNPGGSWQFPLKHIICIMQGSARGFLKGTRTFFYKCPSHSLIGSVEWVWEQGLAWAGNIPGPSHQIHFISFCVQQTQQNKSFYSGFPLVYGKESKVNKKELGGFIISVGLFSFQHSSLFSALQEMQLLSHKTTGTAIPPVQFLLVLCA